MRDGSIGADVDLTDVGRARAEALGRYLREREGLGTRWAESSGVRRCRETAALIVGAWEAVTECAELGVSGAFIADPVEAKRSFHEHGTTGVVRAALAGAMVPGFRTVEEGARVVLDLVAARLQHGEGAWLMVSHDAILMPLIAWAAGERFDDDWLAPLDGVVFVRGAAGIQAIWRGRRGDVPG